MRVLFKCQICGAVAFVRCYAFNVMTLAGPRPGEEVTLMCSVHLPYFPSHMYRLQPMNITF